MLFMRFEVTSKNIDVSSSISSNLSVELKQRLKQWSPGELDQALSSINNNSSVDTSGLHSTLYNDFSESEQEAVRALASLSNSRNSTPFSPSLSPMLQSTDIGGSHAQRLPSAKVMFMYVLTCVDVLAVYFVECVSYYVIT